MASRVHWNTVSMDPPATVSPRAARSWVPSIIAIVSAMADWALPKAAICWLMPEPPEDTRSRVFL